MTNGLKKNVNKKILWILLAIILLLSFSGIKLRVANETNNQTVVTAVDYKEFSRTADLANMDIDNILLRLKDNGVNTVAVSEVSLYDLAYQGDVFISSYGEFSALTKNLYPHVWEKTVKAIGQRSISPVNLTITTSDPDIASFLKERLGSRFLPQELINFSIDEKSYFIVNAQLSPVNITTNPTDKNKQISSTLDARLGFDVNLLIKLKSMGFDIIMRPSSNMGSNTQYLSEYEQIVTDYGIRYLVFAGNDLSGAPDHLDWAENLVNNHQLIIGIIESSTQLQYLKQNGLDELMLATGYPINRVYSTSNDEFVQTIDDRYYRWIRGVIDREIRILYVLPFKDQKISYAQNLNNTLDVIDKFHQTITDKGYSINQPLKSLSGNMLDTSHRLMVSLSLLIAWTLYFLYLFRPNFKRFRLAAWLLLGTLGCIAINLLLADDSANKIYALCAAILYPSFSSLLLLLYLKKNHAKPFLLQILASLAIILGINLLGMYTIVTTLSDIRYIMNVYVFSGVKVAFILPLLLFFLNYVSCISGWTNFKDNSLKLLLDKPNYLILLLGMLGAVGFYYYLGRSGNAVVSVSSLELRIREILESIFVARPRFKELLIGYPALFAMVYLYHRYQHRIILLLLGIGVMMGSISMVNSFCHVFTAVVISASRTAAGLLTGTLIALVLLILIRAGEWLFDRIKTVD